jgi:hypothetical protein
MRQEMKTRELVAELKLRPLSESILARRSVVDNEEEFWKQMIDEKIGASLESTARITELRDGLFKLRNSSVGAQNTKNSLRTSFSLSLSLRCWYCLW